MEDILVGDLVYICKKSQYGLSVGNLDIIVHVEQISKPYSRVAVKEVNQWYCDNECFVFLKNFLDPGIYEKLKQLAMKGEKK
jgi:hypothetical protein